MLECFLEFAGTVSQHSDPKCKNIARLMNLIDLRQSAMV